ncbi:MAG: sugar ABC transporter permease [Clostridia bacterium]|nr:sugar ABC transporter permease [Clostridia bacterium]
MTKKTVQQKNNNSFFLNVKKELYNNRYLYILMIPVLLYYILFCYAPMTGIVIAFKDYQISEGILGSKWVGLKYFKEFFSGMFFTRTLRNTIMISVYDIVFGFPLPVIFALLLNEINNLKYKKIVQTVTYLPHFISMVVICGMIVDFFSRDGVITRLLTLFGFENINYMSDARYFRSIYVGTGIWQGFGWNSIIYIAAISGIDQQLYEAAEIDGAKKIRKVWHITIPGISDTIILMLILRLGSVLSIGAEKVILLYNAGTYETADIISSYVYRTGIGGARYSYSSAVGLFQSVVNFIILIAANGISKKIKGNSLF